MLSLFCWRRVADGSQFPDHTRLTQGHTGMFGNVILLGAGGFLVAGSFGVAGNANFHAVVYD